MLGDGGRSSGLGLRRKGELERAEKWESGSRGVMLYVDLLADDRKMELEGSLMKL